MIRVTLALLILMTSSTLLPGAAHAQQRVRDLGINPGILQPGAWNAITDVDGVLVGHQTIIKGEGIRTGVTVVLPHDGNLFRSRVPAAVYVGNGFGKAVGFTQVQELGELETPIALTNTLSVYQAAHALADYILQLPGNEQVRSVNAVAGETNDGWLNDIRARVIENQDVLAAIAAATSGPVEEGNVGAGTGTRALGFKAGIGTASRVLPESRGGYTVGVLVQSNFGGILQVDGAPVGIELGNFYFSDEIPYRSGRLPAKPASDTTASEDDAPYRAELLRDNSSSDASVSGGDALHQSINLARANSEESAPGEQANFPTGLHSSYDFDADGSVMIIVATDAPLTARNLERLARRAFMAIAKVGGFASNGSGDYVIAFSTHPDVRIDTESGRATITNTELQNAETTPLFLAVVEATEEALLNSLFMSVSMQGHEGRTMPGLPIDQIMEILRKYRVVDEKP
jgi:D-aminopeptidase